MKFSFPTCALFLAQIFTLIFLSENFLSTLFELIDLPTQPRATNKVTPQHYPFHT